MIATSGAELPTDELHMPIGIVVEHDGGHVHYYGAGDFIDYGCGGGYMVDMERCTEVCCLDGHTWGDAVTRGRWWKRTTRTCTTCHGVERVRSGR